MQKIGFGGGCHWCTEAIFRSLKGVSAVKQGWLASDGGDTAFSEAVMVEFDPVVIALKTLIAIHLHTHSCTSAHEMRSRYCSAVYTFGSEESASAKQALMDLQFDFQEPFITRVLPVSAFKLNKDNYLDYYYKDPAKPFCRNIVNPKLKALLARFADQVAPEKKAHLQSLS